MSDKLQFVAKLRQAKACRTSNCITASGLVVLEFECGRRSLRVIHGRDARATSIFNSGVG